MSRTMVLVVTALSLVLMTGLTYAQQTAQPGQQQQQYSQGQSGSPGQSGSQDQSGSQGMQGGSSQIQKLSQLVQQNSTDLTKAIKTAERQAKGKAIAAAFVDPKQHAGMTGQSSSSADQQDQAVHAHVFVFADNQVKEVIVDAKANKVQDTQNRQMLTNPWLESQAGMGGSSGSSVSGSSKSYDSSSAGTSSGSSRGMGGSSGSTSDSIRSQGSSAAQALTGGSMLTLTQVQQLARLADQQNASLDKIIDKAKDQVQGQVIGAFLVPQSGLQASSGQQSGQQQQLTSKVYVVDNNNQLKVVTLDASGSRVINTETQQSLMTSPWQSSRMGTGSSGMGGTSGSSSYGGSSGAQQGQSEQKGSSSGSESGGEQFPTGSSSGSGAGSLGGQ